jgi:hypothetical protein
MPVKFEFPRIDDREEVRELLVSLKTALPSLEVLLLEANERGVYEDFGYRFYHQSFKVYSLQATTERIVAALRALALDRALNDWFIESLRAGTGKSFEPEHNKDWLAVTRPIVEAFFHARFFLEMAVRYGRGLEEPPAMLPSGWAALFYLYNLR